MGLLSTTGKAGLSHPGDILGTSAGRSGCQGRSSGAEPGLEGLRCTQGAPRGWGQGAAAPRGTGDRGTELFGTPAPGKCSTRTRGQAGRWKNLSEGLGPRQTLGCCCSLGADTTGLYICTFSKGKPALGCLLTLQISSLHKPGSAARAWIRAVLCAGVWENTEGRGSLADPQLCPLPGRSQSCPGSARRLGPQHRGTAQRIPRSRSEGSQHKFGSR